MRILVTGANGFVGRALCAVLAERGHLVVAVVRPGRAAPARTEAAVVGDLDGDTDWSKALHGVDAVVHLAARVHVMRDEADDPLAEFRRVNVAGTRRLAEQAAAAGVRRLVFVSSVKVNGDNSPGRPFTDADPPAPPDAYGLSKHEAEMALAAVAAATGLETVVVRPPLVYGPGAAGNFRVLLDAVRRGLPLPLAAVRNRRSLVFVGNLVDALALCAEHPAAAGRTYFVRDGEDVSTAQLFRLLARALGRPARLWPLPPALLRAAATLLGRTAAADRVLGSLQVDDGALRLSLGWRPPFTLAEGLALTVSGQPAPDSPRPPATPSPATSSATHRSSSGR